ncbi:EXD1-like protein [Mya arenaria]|uniref:EXD1-like protein n=1 Tax=Mya arenaria TaxID=6604 RepID=A0ABY7DNV4_MYAAR|nr:EXD1-like protein [Mya arenaria]
MPKAANAFLRGMVFSAFLQPDVGWLRVNVLDHRVLSSWFTLELQRAVRWNELLSLRNCSFWRFNGTQNGQISLEKVECIENGAKRKLIGLQHYYADEIATIVTLEDVSKNKGKHALADEKTVRGQTILKPKYSPAHLRRLGFLDPASLLLKNARLDDMGSSGDEGVASDSDPDSVPIINKISTLFHQAIEEIQKFSVVALAMQGVSIGRKGKLSWLQIQAGGHVFLFDVLRMGKACFDGGLTSILENEEILKADEEVWLERPPRPALIDIAVKNVKHLLELRSILMEKMLEEYVAGVNIFLMHVRDASDGDAERYLGMSHLLPMAFQNLRCFMNSYTRPDRIAHPSEKNKDMYGFRENCSGILQPNVYYSKDSLWHAGSRKKDLQEKHTRENKPPSDTTGKPSTSSLPATPSVPSANFAIENSSVSQPPSLTRNYPEKKSDLLRSQSSSSIETADIPSRRSLLARPDDDLNPVAPLSENVEAKPKSVLVSPHKHFRSPTQMPCLTDQEIQLLRQREEIQELGKQSYRVGQGREMPVDPPQGREYQPQSAQGRPPTGLTREIVQHSAGRGRLQDTLSTKRAQDMPHQQQSALYPHSNNFSQETYMESQASSANSSGLYLRNKHSFGESQSQHDVQGDKTDQLVFEPQSRPRGRRSLNVLMGSLGRGLRRSTAGDSDSDDGAARRLAMIEMLRQNNM